jgi:hypothetical protein
LVSGSTVTTPYFGQGSATEKESQLERSIVMTGLPRFLTDKELYSIIEKSKLQPIAYELFLNPDMKARGLAVLEFDTVEKAKESLTKTIYQPNPKFTVYIKPLQNMMYPGTIGGCTSVKSVLKYKTN